MLYRFLLGLFEGVAIGVGVGVASARGFGLSAPGTVVAAALAGAVGFLVGLIAGRPVWARGAKTEALLKAVAGALFGAGLSLALGRWLTAPVDLSQFALGAGPAGRLLALNLPAIACALALFFELDDTGPNGQKLPRANAAPKQRLDSLRVESSEPDELDPQSEDQTHQARKR